MAEANQAVQLVGAGLILGAFVLLQLGRTAPARPTYLSMNFVGAALLTGEAWRTGQHGFLVLEGVWALASGIALVASVRIRLRGEGGDRRPLRSDRSSPPE